MPVLHCTDSFVSRHRSTAASCRAMVLVACAALALAACDGRSDAHDALPSAESNASVIRDDYGRDIAIGAPPRRIVSLNPATTELLFALGVGGRMVGRTQYDLWPDSARLVPNLGPGMRPNLEAVLGARPDLVVLYASADDRAAADRLTAAGVKTAAFKLDRIRDFARVTRALGQLVGDTARAHLVVDSVTGTLDRVRRATATLPRPTVFFHAWETPLITIGGGSFLSELVDVAGGRNVYADIEAPSAAVTLEDVVRRDPDIVLVSPIEQQRLRAAERWRSLRAVREQRVVAYDTNLVARPSVKLGEAAVSLAALLHPGAVR